MLENLLAAPGWTVQRFVRIGISIYFLALVLGLTEGSDISFIFNAFLPENLSELLGNTVLAGLALAVLMGWHRGPATVILALLLFISSYLQLAGHFLQGGHTHAEAVPAFWREFALIALLLLTYTEPEHDSARLVPFRHFKPRPAPTKSHAPREQAAAPKTISRGQIQRAYHVSPAGHAVSRQLTDEDHRKVVASMVDIG